MALFKIFKGSESSKLTNPSVTGYKTPVDGYAYYDTTTKLFYIDAAYPGATGITRQPINAKKADMATLANAAVYETTEEINSPLHKINTYYGHGLSLNGTTLSLVAGDNNTTLSSITLPPDTHWTTHLRTASSATATTQVTTATSNPYLNLLDNSTVRDSIRFVGSGTTTVQSSADGKTITISSAGGVTDINFNSTSQILQKTINDITEDVVVIPIISGTGTQSAHGGKNTIASGNYSFAYGSGAEATANIAVALGGAKASQIGAIAMGGRVSGSDPTEASGIGSIAIGSSALASGTYTNAFGYKAVAAGTTSIAIGTESIANGTGALALGGRGTVASSEYQTTMGKFNIEDTEGTYALILGNGTNEVRSNALTVDWYGNLTANNFIGSGTNLTSLNASNISNGTLAADRLATSGVTAGSYGPSANTTPAYGATFNVPYITVDAYGRVTAASTKTVKIPASDNTDTKVTQNNTTAANDYRVLLSASANDTAETNTVNKNTNLRYNPSTNTLSTGNITGTGNLNITGNVNLNGETYITSANAGSLLVNGNANFVQSPTAPTPVATSNDTSVATTAFVMNAFTANDAMVFKGVVNANGDLPATHKQGWTYRVATAGTYAGKVCEVGDIIICVTDGTAATDAHWAVIQNNVDGAVYRGANAFTDANIIIADSTAGKVKSSGKTITTTAPTSSSTDTTVPTSKAVWSAFLPLSGGTVTGTVVLSKTQDLSGTANNSPALIIGGATTAAHMELDANEIQAKTNGTSVAPLYINNDGGLVTVGSGGLAITSLTASQAVSTDANKNLVSTNLSVSDPSASGAGITYIATISQGATGKITATKSTVRSASTSQTGVTQYTADNLNTWINQLGTGSSTPVDADYYISQYVGGGTTTTTYHRRPMSALWTYIKGKITAGTYWANIKISDAAKYNTAPEMATLKLNGNTNATAASTSNVTLVYDTTLQALNFVFT